MMQPASTVNTNMNNLVVNVGAIPIAARDQLPWVVRALYFLLFGWWVSAVWVVLGWLVAVTIIGLPVGQWMFLRTNGVLTLQRLK
jgi:hypothetical protein